MKRNFKKGDGIATVVITIILVAIVLLIVPALKQFMADQTTATAQMGSQIVAITSAG